MNNLHGRHWRISLTRLEHGKAEGWISFQSCAETPRLQPRTRVRSDAAAPRPFAYDLAANAASRVTPLTFQSAHTVAPHVPAEPQPNAGDESKAKSLWL